MSRCNYKQIDENLVRNELTTLEKYEQIAKEDEIIRKGFKAKHGRPKKDDTVSSFKTKEDTGQDIGYSKRTVQRACQVVQNILPEVKDNIRGTEVANSTRDLIELAKLEPEKQLEITKPLKGGKCKKLTDAKIIAAREQREKQLKDASFPEDSEIKLYTEDLCKVKIVEESVDLILTDPPYAEDYLLCWKDLSKFAVKVLRPGGWLISYSGTMYLPTVLNYLSNYLEYYWSLACLHQGNTQLVPVRQIMCYWKPILAFYKPPLNDLEAPIKDVVGAGKREKEEHKWQQAEDEASHLIDIFSKPGDVVCDPFLGSGTTATASIKLKRKFTGIDIDPECIKTTELRIKEFYNALKEQERRKQP